MNFSFKNVIVGILCSVVFIVIIAANKLESEKFVLFDVKKTQADDLQEIYKELNILGNVLHRVRNEYVEKPDDKKLIDGAISGMLRALDPHSSYLNEEGYREVRVNTKGQFGGIGIEVSMQDNRVIVVSPIEDTPGYKAGILAGDIITHIDGESIIGLSLSQAVSKMRGEVNVPITLTIRRQKVKKPIEIKVIRDVIKIRSVRSQTDDGIGYLRVAQFSEKTAKHLENAITQIKEDIGDENLKGYILDLRNNPGGLLEQAVKVSDLFLDQGEILSTQSRRKEDMSRYHAKKGDVTNGKPIVILINGGSASASEIVAGALLDHGRAKIVGTRSFGKGSVQTVFPIQSNRAIRLTTSRYFTPSGRSIQARGIEAQYVVKQKTPKEFGSNDLKRGETQLRGHLKTDSDTRNEQQESGSSSFVPKDKEQDTQYNFAKKLLLEGEAAAEQAYNASITGKT